MLLKLGERSLGLEQGHRQFILCRGNTAWCSELHFNNFYIRWKLDQF